MHSQPVDFLAWVQVLLSSRARMKAVSQVMAGRDVSSSISPRRTDTGRDAMSKVRIAVEIIAGVAMIGASATVIWSHVKPKSPQSPKLPDIAGRSISLEDAPSMGSPASNAGLAIFSDFQCEYCGRFARETLPELRRLYVGSGKLFVAFWHFPLLDVHPAAILAHRAADCADREGKFWLLHDRFVQRPGSLDSEFIARNASALGLGSDWRSCFALDRNERLSRDIAVGTKMGIGSTPMFLIGNLQANLQLKVTSVISGAQPLAEFVKIIDGLVRDDRSP
jgi:protein-disulfide isomerase